MKLHLVLAAFAAFTLAAGDAAAQKKPAALEPAEDRQAALNRIKLEQEAQREAAEAKKAEQAAAEAAQRKKAEEAEARRLAAIDKQKKAETARKEKEARCVIKPVMTNADIEACRDLAR